MRSYFPKVSFVSLVAIVVFSLLAPSFSVAENSGQNPVIPVLSYLLVILVAAKIGGHLAAVCHQPAVLGELLIGLILGSFSIFGINTFDFLRHNESVEILSELGVILLLFEVGLETNLHEMMKIGLSAFFVAILGVIAPFILGYYVACYFVPEESFLAHIFAGATLTATSVGITVRVFKDLKVLGTTEAKIVLGAAVADDVMGLLVLAVCTGMIEAHNAGAVLDFEGISRVFILAVGFLVCAVGVGRIVAPLIFKAAAYCKSEGMLLATSLLICFGFAYLANAVGLAPIVGAFTAGLILDVDHYKHLLEDSKYTSVGELVNPITSIFVPIFFISMGAKVDVTVFGQANILGYALCLVIAAVVGKQVCGLGVLNKGVDRFAVGLGMIPRGEVGLIFIGIGSKMLIDKIPVIDSATFGSVIIVVVVTTMITPSLVKWRFSKIRSGNLSS